MIRHQKIKVKQHPARKDVLQVIDQYNTANLEHMLSSSDYDKKEYQKFLNGDISGFENLVLKHKDYLIYFISRLVKDISLAEDFAQDAFVEIYVHKERYRMDTNFKTYLYTIARNKAVDYIRKNSRMMFVENYPEAATDEHELEERVMKEEEKRSLHLAMKSLKDDYRAAITLVDFEEMSYEEAAKILGKSKAQMKVLLHRARKSLAGKLRKAGVA